MKKFFSTKNYLLDYTVLTKIAAAFLIIIIFFIFRQIDRNEDAKIVSNIKTLLRNEINLRNTYALSKSLVDLEKIGVFKCARLQEDNDKFSYYDTILSNNCGNVFFFNTRLVNADLVTQSGFVYRFSFIKNTNYFSIVIEIGSYLLIMTLVFFFNNFVRSTEQKIALKQKVFEIEKSMMEEHARQISHDVSSPLSAIKMVVELVKNIDPEVKEILINSVNRTQTVFDDLKRERSNQLEFVDLNKCLDAIIAEKKLVWLNECKIDYIKNTLPSVVADEEKLKRVLSNILNNAYEAMDDIKDKKISIAAKQMNQSVEIVITDCGKGLSSELISKIGQKGFSHGKDGHATAGSGLGVYSSIQALKSWGGNLTIASLPDQGTRVYITLKHV